MAAAARQLAGEGLKVRDVAEAFGLSDSAAAVLLTADDFMPAVDAENEVVTHA
jgi:hypothetical protein